MAQEEKEINISYETLFDLLRREKSRDALQKLDETFFSDVADYIKTKKQILKNRMQDLGSFSEEELKKIEVQISNVNKILKEFYDKREKKIINMAVARCRTGRDMTEVSNLLPAEKQFYENLISIFTDHRSRILADIIEFRDNPDARSLLLKRNTENPANRMIEKGYTESYAKSMQNIITSNDESIEGGDSGYFEPKSFYHTSASYENSESEDYEEPPADAAKAEEGVKDPKSAEDEAKDVVVRFVQPVPKFMGRNLSEFGPFEADEIASLPEEIAGILLRKGRAEEIKAADGAIIR